MKNTFSKMLTQCRIACVFLFIIWIITGVFYPLCVTAVTQLMFPWKANGSLIKKENVVVGSRLIGQFFEKDEYFWGRPSATTPFPYNAEHSSGSNFGPMNPLLMSSIDKRIAQLKKNDPNNSRLIPVDLVTSSASGLDPEISPLAALYQIPRIAKARKLSEIDIQNLILNTHNRCTMKIFGEARVNVLRLNLALDQLSLEKGIPPNIKRLRQ